MLDELRSGGGQPKLSSAPQPSTLIGSSGLQAVRELIVKTAPTDASVLILGENGTGKELVAREIHARSKRADGPFVAVDMGTISESLFESELFGHQKGAFTGAERSRDGFFRSAHTGTIFLDEIGNLPLHLQSKLLMALEQRVVIPLGSTEPIAFDARVIAATNVNRTQLLDPQCFRQDLLYRINTVEIALPALRHRKDDIPEIAAHFVAMFCAKYQKPGVEISANAKAALQAAPWPGNIRSLRHSLERAVILCEGHAIEIKDLGLQTPPDLSEMNSNAPVDELNLLELERRAIEQAMDQYHGNISQMARALGLTRAALYRRLEKHGIG